MIQVVCACGKRFHAEDRHAGLAIKCPNCRKLVNVLAQAEPMTAPPRMPEEGTSGSEGPDLDRLCALLARLIEVVGAIRKLLAWSLLVLVLILVRSLFRFAISVPFPSR